MRRLTQNLLGETTIANGDTNMFVEGKYYLSDYAGNIAGPYESVQEANRFAVDGDVFLYTIPFKSKESKPKKKIEKISLDFKNKKIIITGDEGAEVTLNKVVYDLGETSVDDEELKEWGTLLTDATKVCSNITFIGRPPVEGEYLNEMLHL